MDPAALRKEIVELVQMLASREQQQNYDRKVPFADVPTELRCMWFDEYQPESVVHLEAFTPAERERLARFHVFFEKRLPPIPNTLAKMHRSPAWLEVMAEARRVLDDLGLPEADDHRVERSRAISVLSWIRKMLKAEHH